jgi:GAF domain-containing protein
VEPFYEYSKPLGGRALFEIVLEQLGLVVSSAGIREQKARLAAEMIREARNYRWVGIYDVLESEIAVVGWTGELPAFPHFPRAEGLSGEAVRTGAVVVANDIRHQSRYLTTFGTTQSEVIIPVCNSRSQVVGTVDVESDRLNAFEEQDVRFLKQCASALEPLFARS